MLTLVRSLRFTFRASWLGLFVALVSSCAPSSTGHDVAMHEAIGRGDIEEVRSRLAAGFDNFEPPCPPHLNCRPLSYAAMKGEFETVKLLVEAGADLDAPGVYLDVPFIKATAALTFGVPAETVRAIQSG